MSDHPLDKIARRRSKLYHIAEEARQARDDSRRVIAHTQQLLEDADKTISLAGVAVDEAALRADPISLEQAQEAVMYATMAADQAMASLAGAQATAHRLDRMTDRLSSGIGSRVLRTVGGFLAQERPGFLAISLGAMAVVGRLAQAGAAVSLAALASVPGVIGQSLVNMASVWRGHTDRLPTFSLEVPGWALDTGILVLASLAFVLASCGGRLVKCFRTPSAENLWDEESGGGFLRAARIFSLSLSVQAGLVALLTAAIVLGATYLS